jgi:hypothetical protein
MKPSLLRRLAGALAITLASAAPAAADNFPSKPITFVVPFAPGAGTDQLARGMAQAMQASFPGATVVVENKPGAGGIIAAQAAARAAPDGHTLFITTNTTQSANPHLFKKLPYDPVGDFAPLAAIARGTLLPHQPQLHRLDQAVVHAGRQRRDRARPVGEQQADQGLEGEQVVGRSRAPYRAHA